MASSLARARSICLSLLFALVATAMNEYETIVRPLLDRGTRKSKSHLQLAPGKAIRFGWLKLAQILHDIGVELEATTKLD